MKEKKFRRWDFRYTGPGLRISEASMTQQSHADTCDMNRIISQFHRTGELPHGRHQPAYEDVSGLSGDLLDLSSRSRSTIEDAEAFVSKQREIKRESDKKAASADSEVNAPDKSVIPPDKDD